MVFDAWCPSAVGLRLAGRLLRRSNRSRSRHASPGPTGPGRTEAGPVPGLPGRHMGPGPPGRHPPGVDLRLGQPSTEPGHPAVAGTTNPDHDGDGLFDWWELQEFGDLLQTGAGDTDGDGLTNIQEYLHRTSPTFADTD